MRLMIWLAVGVIMALSTCEPSHAINIPTSLDLDIVRPPMPNEGYLHFIDGGEDLTGWIDTRNPAFYNGADRRSTTVTNTTNPGGIGYDRSDFQVRVQNVIVTDKNGVTAGANQASIERNFNFANQIYRQLGISVLSTGNIDAAYNNVTFPVDINSFAEVNKLWAANRPAGNTVPNYYVRDFTPAAGGVAGGPNLPGVVNNNGGTAVGDVHFPDALAHEVGHFLLDNSRFNNPDNLHSPVLTDLVCGTLQCMFPNDNVKSTLNTQFQRLNGAPSQPGQKVGGIGGLDQFSAPVGPMGGPFTTAQIDAIYSSASVLRTDHGATFGDRADFNFVEDNIPLEEAAARTGSNQRMVNHTGFDFMVWQINQGAVPAPLDEAALDHQTPAPDLNLPGFNGPFFRTADVVSLISRYADMDVDPTSLNWSARESALDYILQFSIDGITWVNGIPVNVFDRGWTAASQAEDFLVRWNSPVDARFVRIQADTLVSEDDRNTQIDAIIVSQVLVGPIDGPSSILLLLCGAFLLFAIARRWRSRTT